MVIMANLIAKPQETSKIRSIMTKMRNKWAHIQNTKPITVK